MRKTTFILPAIVVLLALVGSSIFVVDEREKALVLQFGQIKRVKEDPGLAFKVPFIQEVVTYDARILSLDTDETEVTPSDDRRLVVDAFARYRIADVVQFRQAVGVGGIRSAEDRLESILNAQIRAVLRPGGLWLNHGPLLYHCDRGASIAPRLCADELLLLVERSGFELVETADHACSYSQDPHSMCVSRYTCLFFCARKRDSE